MEEHHGAVFAAALEAARATAYPPGEYVGQESFVLAREVLELARRAGVGPGTRVLDLCCGTAGPGRLVADRFGCGYLGVDSSSGAVELARGRARGPACEFVVAQVPPLPEGRFDIVLLLETMLAFEDKASLLRAIAGALSDGGRLAFTLEEGEPLTTSEQAAMPRAATVRPIPLADLLALLAENGLRPIWRREWTASHRTNAAALLAAYTRHAEAATRLVGERAVRDLIEAHRLWCDWLGRGRVRKFAIVARRSGALTPPT